MAIDPAFAEMAARLAQLAVTNASAVVYSKVKSITAGKATEQAANELRGIIDELLAERNDLVTIARAYEEQLVSQRISDQEIEYITKSVIPVLKDLAEKTAASGDPAAAQNAEQALDFLERLLSVEMLTVLQLVGFNFKRAIGEPLTLVLQKLITAQIRPDQQSVQESMRLSLELNLALANIAQDEAASDRLKQVLTIWRATPESQ